MRSPIGMIGLVALSAIATIAASGPARAQTYDPNYPVCIQIFTPDGGYIDCSFTSIPQCQATASGRAAMCMVNPYFAPRAPGRSGGPRDPRGWNPGW